MAGDPAIEGKVKKKKPQKAQFAKAQGHSHGETSKFSSKAQDTAMRFWYKAIILICGAAWLFDRFSDVIVVYFWCSANYYDWALVTAFIFWLPGLVLCFVHLERCDITMAMRSLLGISMLIAVKASWHAETPVRAMKVETVVYALFSSLPQFYFQAYIITHNHFVSLQCEMAFDAACIAPCTRMSPEFEGMTRLKCIELSLTNGTAMDECWTTYGRCLKSCPMLYLVRSKGTAVSKMENAMVRGDFQTTRLMRRQAKVAGRKLQSAMDFHSDIWKQNGCRVDGTRYAPLFGEDELDTFENITTAATLGKIRTLKSSLFAQIPQIFATTSALLSVSASVTMRVVEERFPDGTTLELTTKCWVKKVIGYFTHFTLDMLAVVFSCSWVWASMKDLSRYACFFAIFLLFQIVYWFSHAKAWRNITRVSDAALVFLISPLATLPGGQDKEAHFICSLLRLRFVLQEVLIFTGFALVSKEDVLGHRPWLRQLYLAQALCIGAFMSTRLFGPATVWTTSYDMITMGKNKALEGVTPKNGNQGMLSMLEDQCYPMLKEVTKAYLIDNSELHADTPGVGYRLSKHLADIASDDLPEGQFAAWGTVIDGIDCQDGWLRVEIVDGVEVEVDLFLPKSVNGIHVLTLHPEKRMPEDETPLKVTIASATGLQFDDGTTAFLDPYVVCAIVDATTPIGFRTAAMHGEHNPEWNHSEEMPRWMPGNSLIFKVFDKDDFTMDTCIGVAELKASSFESPFDGDLKLDTKGSLRVKIAPPAKGVILDCYAVIKPYQSDADGLEYCLSMSTDHTSGIFESWGHHVHGCEESLGWIRVRDKYLPMFQNGVPVLDPLCPEKLFLIDNSELKARTAGVGFRLSRKMDDRDVAEALAVWGMKLRGVQTGPDWVRIGTRYLPTHLDGHLVVIELTDDPREHALLEHLAIQEMPDDVAEVDQEEAERFAEHEPLAAEAAKGSLGDPSQGQGNTGSYGSVSK